MFILSDIHADKRMMNSFLESKEKYCLQLGDFGFIWRYNDWKWNKFLNHFEKDYPDKVIFTILGNHENYDSIERMPFDNVCGGKVRRIKKNVFAVERGEFLFVEGKKILCVGGANSTDKEWRIIHENSTGERIWWPQEEVKLQDIERAIKKIDENGNPDIVLTHCTPYWFKQRFYNWPIDNSEKLIGDLERQTTYDKWYCGHIHEHQEAEGTNGGIIKSLAIGEYEII